MSETAREVFIFLWTVGAAANAAAVVNGAYPALAAGVAVFAALRSLHLALKGK